MITLFILGGVAYWIAVLAAGWLGVGRYDIAVLALALAPLSLLSHFHTRAHYAAVEKTGDKRKYQGLNKIMASLLGVLFFYGLYKYVLLYGFFKMMGAFLLAALVQGPLYSVLKLNSVAEVLLYPIAMSGITLFYVNALGVSVAALLGG